MLGGRRAIRIVPRPAPGLLAGLIGGLLSVPAVAWADAGHDQAEPALPVPPVVWVVGLVLTLVVVAVMVWQARRGGGYLQQIRGFSRNARLLIFRSPFNGLSVSLWRLLFYLYLLAAGHDTLFVAQLASVNWILHGLMVIPSGILSDLFGRRIVFLVFYTGNVLASASLIMVSEPTTLLVLAALQGAFEGGHAIVGPPFMVEQSRVEERVHLFSIDGFFRVGAASLGNLLAGLLPLAIGRLLGLSPTYVDVLRLSLFCAIPVMVLSVIPIYLIDERWERIDVRQWWRTVQSYGPIGMLALTEAGTGLALGMTAPFFNIFFAQELGASTTAIGLVFALGSVVTAFATLLAPAIVRVLGRVRMVVYLKLLGLPFLVAIGLSQSVVVAGVFYVIAILLVGGAFPNRAVSDPVFTLFAMESVQERERGTTNGIMHAFSELPMGVGAWIAGPLMAAGNWALPYWLAGAIYGVTFLAFLGYFHMGGPEMAPHTPQRSSRPG